MDIATRGGREVVEAADGVHLAGLLAGERVEGGKHRVGADSGYLIPVGQLHATVNRTDGLTEGVDVSAPPRTAPDWQ